MPIARWITAPSDEVQSAAALSRRLWAIAWALRSPVAADVGLGLLISALRRMRRQQILAAPAGPIAPELSLAVAVPAVTHGPSHDSPDHGRHGPSHEPHSHGFGSHSHTHGPGFSRGGLVGLRVAGGLVPSPSALLVLLAAIALGRTAFGIALVLGDSLWPLSPVEAIANVAQPPAS